MRVERARSWVGAGQDPHSDGRTESGQPGAQWDRDRVAADVRDDGGHEAAKRHAEDPSDDGKCGGLEQELGRDVTARAERPAQSPLGLRSTRPGHDRRGGIWPWSRPGFLYHGCARRNDVRATVPTGGLDVTVRLPRRASDVPNRLHRPRGRGPQAMMILDITWLGGH